MKGLLAFLFGRRQRHCKLQCSSEDTLPAINRAALKRMNDSGELVKRALEEMRLAQLSLEAFEMPHPSKRNGGTKASSKPAHA